MTMHDSDGASRHDRRPTLRNAAGNGRGTETMDDNSRRVTDEEALFLHASGRPGKIEIAPTKPLTTQRDLMDIPVFHDDQHGTAIVAAAGLINALDLTNRKLKDIKLVVNGAGAASIACVELLKSMGVPHDQVILCDTKGVIFEGRTEGM